MMSEAEVYASGRVKTMPNEAPATMLLFWPSDDFLDRIRDFEGGKRPPKERHMTSATRRTGAALAVALVAGLWGVAAQRARGRWDTEKYAKLPQPAEKYTPVQVNDKLYLIGGNAAVLTPGARSTHPARVMVYDLPNNAWAEKKNTPFFADHMSAATANGKIYVFGGSGAMTQEAPSATLAN